MQTLKETIEDIKKTEQVRLYFKEISDANAIDLEKALKESAILKSLYLANNQMGPLVMKHIADALEVSETIVSVELKENSIDTAGIEHLARALKTNKTLTELNISENIIDSVGVKSIAEALKENNTLKTLTLWSNGINDEDVAILIDALTINRTLKNINLSFNPLGDYGATLFASLLGTNSELNLLNLLHTNISSEGVAPLTDALKKNKKLNKLVLSYNPIGDKGAELLAGALQENHTLEELALHAINIGTQGIAYLISALKENSTLATLDLQNNQLDASSIELIAHFLQENETIKRLDLSNNVIKDEGVKLLVEAVKNNYTLLQLEGVFSKELFGELYGYLLRNKKLAEPLGTLHNAIHGKSLLNDPKIIETCVSGLETVVSELNTLPQDSYLVEAHRLLTAIGHESIYDRQSALHSLFPPFKNADFQKFADLKVGLILAGGFSEEITDDSLKQKCQLLSLYSLRNHLNSPEVKNFAYIVLFKLMNKGDFRYQDKLAFEKDIKLLTEDDFLTLLKEALENCNTNYEKQLLNNLLESKISNPFTLTNAYQSPTFIKTFKSHYPEAKSFTTIDHCLFSVTKGNSFLMNLEPEKTVIELINEVKQTLGKALFEEIEAIQDESKQEISVSSHASAFFKKAGLESEQVGGEKSDLPYKK